MKALQLQVVTPQKNIVDVEVESVMIPGSEGDLGILPQHVPLVTTLKTGSLVYQIKDKSKTIAVQGGFALVQQRDVIILTDKAEPEN